MYQLFETIKIFNGKIYNVEYHNRRFNASRKKLFDCREENDVSTYISVPNDFKSGLVKCKLIYSDKIESIQFFSYQIRKINSLKIVACNEIEYGHKFLNREIFEELKIKSGCSISQEILIVKNGLITDTSISNVVLFNGAKWFTPTKPLLKGTKRASLLDSGLIFEEEIRVKDLHLFTQIKLINAMIDIDDNPAIDIQCVT